MDARIKQTNDGRWYIYRPCYLWPDGKWRRECSRGYYYSEAEAEAVLRQLRPVPQVMNGDGDGI
jgi:hypothetical protein